VLEPAASSRPATVVNIELPPAKIAQTIFLQRRTADALDSLRMPEPINSTEAVGGSQTDHEAEIARRDEEILRLRDLLITRDAELGQVRGQLKIIEDHSERMARLVARIPIPGLAWVASAILRVLQVSGR